MLLRSTSHKKLCADIFNIQNIIVVPFCVCVGGGVVVLDPCFVMQYFVSFLVLQSSHCGREIILFALFYCLLCVMWMLSFIAFSVGLQCVIVSFPDHTHVLF